MDIFKGERIHTQECTKHIINPQHNNRTREDARNCALSFCAYTVREKETTTHKERGQDQEQKPSSQEDKPRTTKTKPKKIGEEDEKRIK